MLNNLYKHTPLQTSFGVNMVALVDGVPRTLNLVQALQAYIDHQVEVIRRRTEFRLRQGPDRAHIVEGLLKALDMIDAIIALIRGSEDRPAARDGADGGPVRVQRDPGQAHPGHDAVGRLTRLGRHRPRGGDGRAAPRPSPSSRPSSPTTVRLRGVIKDEMTAIRDEFATPRRAEITFDVGDMNAEDLIDDEELVITMTRAGYIKAMPGRALPDPGPGRPGRAGRPG